MEETKNVKPNCYKCVHKMEVPGSRHSRCNNFEANVIGNPNGIKRGWFNWPLNFDPTWLQSCDGFSDNPKDKKKKAELDPLTELLAMLR
jgi:hypothetical protein